MFAEDKWHESEKIIMDNGAETNMKIHSFVHSNCMNMGTHLSLNTEIHTFWVSHVLGVSYFSRSVLFIPFNIHASHSFSFDISRLSLAPSTDKFVPDVIYTFELIM